MVGSIALAYFALSLPEVGGVPGLLSRLSAPTFELLPQIETAASASSSLALPLSAFVAYLGIQCGQVGIQGRNRVVAGTSHSG